MKQGSAVAVALCVLVGLSDASRPWRSRAAWGRPAPARSSSRRWSRRRSTQLPAGPLFWRVESFPTLAQAQAAAGPMSLAAESRGKVWLFTLGPAGGASSGGTNVAEVGPIPAVEATQYLLRINEASGPPGSVTPVHSHPGSEAVYVLAGEQCAPDAPRREARRGRQRRGRPRRRHADAGFEQRLGGPARVGHVRGRRQKPFSKPATMP